MSDASSIPAAGVARTAEVTRNTLETRIRVRVDLDGTGKARLKTGVPFFEHMLDQIVRHGLVDLDIEAEGDTHIDDHHTVEDVGIALGQALAQALGDKRGIRRYDHAYVPLDEALSHKNKSSNTAMTIMISTSVKPREVREVRKM